MTIETNECFNLEYGPAACRQNPSKHRRRRYHRSIIPIFYAILIEPIIQTSKDKMANKTLITLALVRRAATIVFLALRTPLRLWKGVSCWVYYLKGPVVQSLVSV